jgi:hypothetical protein
MTRLPVERETRAKNEKRAGEKKQKNPTAGLVGLLR